jgi:nicotinamidase/pyrazinamidase
VTSVKALIIVDVQNDFLPGGALAVPQGDAVIPVANRLIESGKFDLVVATQDWHPADHGSFAANHPGKRLYDRIDLFGLEQTLWPIHCVQGTRGAELSSSLSRKRRDHVVQKGTDKNIDSYSGFFDNGHRKATGLEDYLRSKNATDPCVCGLATDYCVKFTALDAVQLGFRTTLIEDGCRGVNIRSTDSRDAIDAMRRAGVNVVRSDDVLKSVRD